MAHHQDRVHGTQRVAIGLRHAGGQAETIYAGIEVQRAGQAARIAPESDLCRAVQDSNQAVRVKQVHRRRGRPIQDENRGFQTGVKKIIQMIRVIMPPAGTMAIFSGPNQSTSAPIRKAPKGAPAMKPSW